MKLRPAILTVLICLAAGVAPAQTVYLFLKANGNDVPGESRVRSLGRAGSIPCLSFEFQTSLPFNAATTMATGVRSYLPVKFVKPVDKASVTIWQALTTGAPVEAIFKFYRPSPSGSGQEEQYYTVKLTKARIVGFRQMVTPSASGEPPTDEVLVAFGEITCTYTDGGIEYHDSLPSGRAVR